MSIHNKQSGGAGQRAIPSRLKGFAAGIAVASAVTLALPSMPAHATNIATYTSPVHTFSIDDTIGGFDGVTFADDPRIICGLPTDLYPNSPACPEDGQGTVTDRRTGLTLYPVESVFGFEVTDFVGAEQKVQDFDYEEGFVADLFNDTGDLIGMLGRSARTARFKAAAPLGTSCAGLGAGDVKCSTEHYTVMEHVLTCFETIPYFFATPLTGPQGDLIDPITGELLGTCDDPPGDLVEGKLDNLVLLIVDGELTTTPVLPDATTGFPDIPANEGDVLNDIAQSTDYGLTKKDDGKPLYRWGTIVKRPTDLRFYIQLLVPEVWKTAEEPFEVASAELVVAHKITNNPNDQIRPEDYENEGATGRIPGIIKDPGYVDNPDTNVVEEVWYSDQDCFEGDGDFIAAGTVFKN